ncbi:MAG: T9SS type A sorting domain-containing protein [Flavobacteriales bacterium]
MKSIFSFLLFSLVILQQLNAQVHSTQLELNNVSAHISDAGTFFTNFDTAEPSYEVPKGTGVSAIFSTQFWFAGKDSLNNIHFCQGGSPNVGTDVFNGPVSGVGTYSTNAYQTTWGNSMWSLCQTDIDQFKLWWGCQNGLITSGCGSANPPSNEALQTIYNWPAHGNVAIGQSYFLAPFFDYDSDGIYNPDLGDYPMIKGCCASYIIQNDVAQSHSYSGTDSIGLELHLMFYQYQTFDYLNDVTFIDVTAINRGDINYPEFAHSIFVDVDLGNYVDDLIGCDSTKNLMYFYNGDNNDEASFSTLGYGNNPPAIGIVGLKQDITSSACYAGGFQIADKWNIMNGLQFSGDPWLNPNGNPTAYLYSGNPNVSTEWSEISNGNPPGDRRGISSMNIGSFNSGDTLSQTYAIIYSKVGNHLQNVQSLIDLSGEIKTFYVNESNIPCQNGTWNVDEIENLQLTIAPNPAVNEFNVTSSSIIEKLEIFDLSGRSLSKFTDIKDLQFKVDCHFLSPGNYILQMESSEKMVRKQVQID